jgi:hypothetical protein
MATNITFHEGAVGDEERSGLLNQKGATIWLTGLSASGKVSPVYLAGREREEGVDGQRGSRTNQIVYYRYCPRTAFVAQETPFVQVGW